MQENKPLKNKDEFPFEEKKSKVEEFKKEGGEISPDDFAKFFIRPMSFVENNRDFVEDYSTLTQFDRWLKREVPVEQQKICKNFYLIVLAVMKATRAEYSVKEGKEDKEKKKQKAKRIKKERVKFRKTLLAMYDLNTSHSVSFSLCLLEDIVGCFQKNKNHKVSRVCSFIKKHSNFFVKSFNSELAHWIKNQEHESKKTDFSERKNELKEFSESFIQILETAKDVRLKDDEYRQKAVKSYPHLADPLCCFMDAVIAVDEKTGNEKLEAFLRYPLNKHVLDFLDKELPKLELIIRVWKQQRPISKILAASLREVLALPVQSAQVSVSEQEESGIERRKSS